MTTDPAKRTDRTARKATAEQVMELSRNLPLTRSVLRRAVENATPGQLGFLAALFTAENASRAESKRNRLLRQAGFPQSKELDGYDWSMAAFPTDWGREQLVSLEFIDRAEDLVLHGRRGHARRTSPRHRHRHPRLQAGHTGQVLHRLRPDHAAAQGQNREQARPGTQDHRQGRPARHRRTRLPAHRHRRRQAPIPGSSPTATVRRSIIFTSNLEFGRWGDVFGDGDMAAAVIDRIVHHGRIIRFHGESYRNTHSLMK